MQTRAVDTDGAAEGCRVTPRLQVHALEGAEEAFLVTPRLEAAASVHALIGAEENAS